MVLHETDRSHSVHAHTRHCTISLVELAIGKEDRFNMWLSQTKIELKQNTSLYYIASKHLHWACDYYIIGENYCWQIGICCSVDDWELAAGGKNLAAPQSFLGNHMNSYGQSLDIYVHSRFQDNIPFEGQSTVILFGNGQLFLLLATFTLNYVLYVILTLIV